MWGSDYNNRFTSNYPLLGLNPYSDGCGVLIILDGTLAADMGLS